MNHSLEQYMSDRSRQVNEALNHFVRSTVEWPGHLRKAICYTLFPGGKRLRPLLVIAGYEAVAAVPDLSVVMPTAAAVEMLHTYALIHDDLPAMDDDDTRRGRPTSHRVHGEALAILAGDALQARAFQSLTDRSLFPPGTDPALLLDIAHDVAVVAGEEGIVGGQSMDLGYEGEVKGAEQLAFLFAKKTGGLIRASILAGARMGSATPEQLTALSTFGDRLGVAFQITDDLLDDGEPSPVQARGGRRPIPSMVEVLGARGSRDWCERAVTEAQEAIELFDERADPLREIARWVPDRKA